MSAPGIGDVVCNLLGCGESRADVVSADGSEVCSIGENDARKPLVCGMVRNVYTLVAAHLKTQALKSRSTLNSKVRGKNRVCEPIAELIQKPAADLIVMRHQETPVMLGVHVVRQQWVYNVHSKILPVEPGIHLLLRGKDLVNSGIEAVCVRWNRHQCLVIDAAKRRGQIRQWIVSIQQRRGEGADVRNGKVRI